MRTTAADTTQSNSHLYPARNVQPNTIHRSFSDNEQSAVATCKFFRSHSLKASFPGTVALTCHKAKHLQQKLFCEEGDSGKPIPLPAFSLRLLNHYPTTCYPFFRSPLGWHRALDSRISDVVISVLLSCFPASSHCLLQQDFLVKVHPDSPLYTASASIMVL